MITGRKILPLFYIHVRVLSFLEGTVEALFSSINTRRETTKYEYLHVTALGSEVQLWRRDSSRLALYSRLR